VRCAACGKRCRAFYHSGKWHSVCNQHPSAKRMPAAFIKKQFEQMRRAVPVVKSETYFVPLRDWNAPRLMDGAGI